MFTKREIIKKINMYALSDTTSQKIYYRQTHHHVRCFDAEIILHLIVSVFLRRQVGASIDIRHQLTCNVDQTLEPLSYNFYSSFKVARTINHHFYQRWQFQSKWKVSVRGLSTWLPKVQKSDLTVFPTASCKYLYLLLYLL